jgi:two-component system, sensor histidine kinase YesM
MNEKLSKSLSELLHAKSEEMNAKLLAIQSQMNPHFLHNNLANISVMAEEGMYEEIVSLCNDVSFMLRYISVESKTGIDLLSEIDYTQKYLNCMKIRYEENLEYNIEIPDIMMNLIVPKLIVQPLVENSIKYGLNTQPPWCITIQGVVNDNKWYIAVYDTGTGFSPTILAQFDHFIDNLKDFGDQAHLQIGGMGLLNICMRLKLLYKDDAVIILKNLPNGGASVTIGGTIYRDNEK